MSSSAIDIILLGRTYSVACPAGQEAALRSVAHKLEQQLVSLKNRASHLSREDLVMMAALNIGHELSEEKQKNQEYMQQVDQRIRLMQRTLEQALVERSRKDV